jgi:hypothetical protein
MTPAQEQQLLKDVSDLRVDVARVEQCVKDRPPGNCEEHTADIRDLQRSRDNQCRALWAVGIAAIVAVGKAIVAIITGR